MSEARKVELLKIDSFDKLRGNLPPTGKSMVSVHTLAVGQADFIIIEFNHNGEKCYGIVDAGYPLWNKHPQVENEGSEMDYGDKKNSYYLSFNFIHRYIRKFLAEKSVSDDDLNFDKLARKNVYRTDISPKIKFIALSHEHLDHILLSEKLILAYHPQYVFIYDDGKNGADSVKNIKYKNYKVNLKKIFCDHCDNWNPYEDIILDPTKKYKPNEKIEDIAFRFLCYTPDVLSDLGNEIISDCIFRSFKYQVPTTNNANPNDFSHVFQMKYKDEASILFTGDLSNWTSLMEDKKNREELKSDILKVAHHGSKNGHSFDSLKCICPEYAIMTIMQDLNGKKDLIIKKAPPDIEMINLFLGKNEKYNKEIKEGDWKGVGERDGFQNGFQNLYFSSNHAYGYLPVSTIFCLTVKSKKMISVCRVNCDPGHLEQYISMEHQEKSGS